MKKKISGILSVTLIAVLLMGNTAFINEDYTHTYHFSKHHTATVTNANGAFANDANPGRWAQIEVTHSGNSVKYAISY